MTVHIHIYNDGDGPVQANPPVQKPSPQPNANDYAETIRRLKDHNTEITNRLSQTVTTLSDAYQLCTAPGDAEDKLKAVRYRLAGRVEPEPNP